MNRWLVLLAVMLAFLPIVLDLTILHVAIPSLTLALGATGAAAGPPSGRRSGADFMPVAVAT